MIRSGSRNRRAASRFRRSHWRENRGVSWQLSSLVQLDLNRATGSGHPKNMGFGGVFLKAEWRSLAMLNYEVDPRLLTKFVPAGTELDRWNGKVFASLVGFRF